MMEGDVAIDVLAMARERDAARAASVAERRARGLYLLEVDRLAAMTLLGWHDFGDVPARAVARLIAAQPQMDGDAILERLDLDTERATVLLADRTTEVLLLHAMSSEERCP
jgi:hypothetical protein